MKCVYMFVLGAVAFGAPLTNGTNGTQIEDPTGILKIKEEVPVKPEDADPPTEDIGYVVPSDQPPSVDEDDKAKDAKDQLLDDKLAQFEEKTQAGEYHRRRFFTRGCWKQAGGDSLDTLLTAYNLNWVRRKALKNFGNIAYKFAMSHDYTQLYFSGAVRLFGVGLSGLAGSTGKIVTLGTPFAANHPILGKITATFSWTKSGLLQTMTQTDPKIPEPVTQKDLWYFPSNDQTNLWKDITFRRGQTRITLNRKYTLDTSQTTKLFLDDTNWLFAKLDSTELLQQASAHTTTFSKQVQHIEKVSRGSLARYGNFDELAGGLQYDDVITTDGLVVKADGFGPGSVTVIVTGDAGVYTIPEGTLITTGSKTSNLVVYNGFTGYVRADDVPRTIKLDAHGCDANYASHTGAAKVTQLRFRKAPINALAAAQGQALWYETIKPTFPNADRAFRMSRPQL